jgi:hypothetical protein
LNLPGLFDAHHVFDFIFDNNFDLVSSKSIIQVWVTSVDAEASQTSQFAFCGDHDYVVQTYPPNYLGAYLLVAPPKYEALTADRRDDYLGGFSLYLLYYLFLVYVMRHHFLVAEKVHPQESFLCV